MSREIEQIKDRLDIVDLVGSYIKLDKAGRNYKARCPFHSEKTPSFIVSPERQTFYCFGCSAHGDLFTFVEKFEGLEFKEVLQVLAEKAGVELKPFKKEGDRQEQDKKEKILQALERAASLYQKFLGKEPAQEKYLQDRGLNKEAIKKWRIGSAPSEWRVLLNALKEEGFKEDELLEAGLIKETGGKRYDVFRGRIMFPIFDIGERVVAFSGRIFVDDGKSPKYVNTPETELFKKSEILYGLHLAKSTIRRLDYSVLVEGQVDLVLSHQVGVVNTVASSGTALTEFHLRRLQKLSNRIILAYDADEAGRAAARRSGELALSLGMEVKIATLPEGEDPASIIRKSGSKWKEILKGAVSLIEFAIDESLRKQPKSNLIREFSRSVLPLLSSVQSEMLRSEFVALAAKKTKIPEKGIWADLEKLSAKGVVFESGNELSKSLILSPEEMLVGLILWQKFDEIEKQLKELMGEETVSEITGNSRFDKETLIFETEAKFSGGGELDLKKAAEEILLRIEKGVLERKLEQVARSLDTAETPEIKAKLKKEAEKISKRISEIN